MADVAAIAELRRLINEPTSAALFRVPGVGNVTTIAPNPWTTNTTTATVPTHWYRAQTYQLLSPGLDRTYGPGGPIAINGREVRYPGDVEARQPEEDNVGMR